MLWGKFKVDVVGAPRCEGNECSREEEEDLVDGPYRGTVVSPIQRGESSLAREMYDISVAARAAKVEAEALRRQAVILNTKDVVVPEILAEILMRAKNGSSYAELRSLTRGMEYDYDVPTLVEELEARGFSVVSVGAGGSDQIKWIFDDEGV